MRRTALVLLLAIVLMAGLAWFALRPSHGAAADDMSDGSRSTTATTVAPPSTKSTASGTARDGGTTPVTGGARATGDGGSLDGGEATSPSAQRDARNAEWLKKNAALAEKAVDRFCEENRQLEHSRPLPPLQGSNDAAESMSTRVDWEGGRVSNGSLHLPEPLRNQLKAAGNDWPSALTPATVAGLDFTWMHQLLAYDSWEVARYGPWRDGTPTDFSNAPIPNYISLLEWSKLRFVQAFVDGDFASADAEVRHLAGLIQSNGLIIADAIAIALLNRVIAVARDAAVAMGRDVSGWPDVDVSGAARMRRVAMSGASFFAPGVSGAVMKKAHDCLTTNPCSALVEGLGMQLSAMPGSGQNPELVERYARQAGCSERLLEVVARTRPQTGDAELDFSAAPGVWAIYPDGGAP